MKSSGGCKFLNLAMEYKNYMKLRSYELKPYIMNQDL